MLPTKPILAQQFAESIAQKFSSQEFCEALRSHPPQSEHKATASLIRACLEEFLIASVGSDHLEPVFDWEGNKRKRKLLSYGYPVLGTWSFPDAAVLTPFRCAFEFDRERKNSSGFKSALMKASVHVLSGAYEACVLVYILRPDSPGRNYIEDKSNYTQRIAEMLHASGLHVAFVNLS